ncbi:MAG: CDP-alcohol phosphatidyltransferase family protein [Nocardioidaceae bacterium]
MLDTKARRLVSPVLESLAARLSDAGVPPLAITGAGWVAGVAACVSAATGSWTPALLLWLLNRLLDGLDGPVARRRGQTDLGGFLDIVADFSIYAGFVVGVAIAVPEARLACLVLLAAYYLSGTAFLALSGLVKEDSRRWYDGRSLRFVGGLAEGTETILVYVAFCLLPAQAAVIAWSFSVVVAVTALQRIAMAVHVLRGRQTPCDQPVPELQEQ